MTSNNLTEQVAWLLSVSPYVPQALGPPPPPIGTATSSQSLQNDALTEVPTNTEDDTRSSNAEEPQQHVSDPNPTFLKAALPGARNPSRTSTGHPATEPTTEMARLRSAPNSPHKPSLLSQSRQAQAPIQSPAVTCRRSVQGTADGPTLYRVDMLKVIQKPPRTSSIVYHHRK